MNVLKNSSNLINGNLSLFAKLGLSLIPATMGLGEFLSPNWSDYSGSLTLKDWRYTHSNIIGTLFLIISLMMIVYFVKTNPKLKPKTQDS